MKYELRVISPEATKKNEDPNPYCEIRETIALLKQTAAALLLFGAFAVFLLSIMDGWFYEAVGIGGKIAVLAVAVTEGLLCVIYAAILYNAAGRINDLINTIRKGEHRK